jgi:hypothetical protein
MSDWKNKIVGHDQVDPAVLVANDKNWRKHPEFQRKALRGAIGDVGFIRSVTVNRRTNRIIDGHLRVDLALAEGVPTITVEYVDLSESEEAEALATLDPLASLAGTDPVQFDCLLREVHTGSTEIQELLAGLAKDAGLYQSGDPPDPLAQGDGDEDEGEGSARQDPDEPPPTRPVIQYTIIFDTKDQQERWYLFLKSLRERYPNTETIGQRLDHFVQDYRA